MITVSKKLTLIVTILMVLVTSGAWQGTSTAHAQAVDGLTAPLAPWLTWSGPVEQTKSLQMSISGDALELSGQVFSAAEKFAGEVPAEIWDFYSNVSLYQSGWKSDNAYEDATGVHRVFYHDAGYYLSIDFVHCADDDQSFCVFVWLSSPAASGTFHAAQGAPTAEINPSAVFFKKTPLDKSTGINPASAFLSWSSYAGTEKFSYCITEDLACAKSDPNWTGTYTNTSVTINNLNPNKTYHWNVKAITCMKCNPKVYILADGGVWWMFKTSLSLIKITGNAGTSYAELSWFDGVAKTTSADSTGNYTIYVTYGWTGTITPKKTGFAFTPASRSYTNVTANQIGRNYLATASLTISGNAGVGGATLTYDDSGIHTVTADSSGNYVLPVSDGWSGSVTPSKVGYLFSPTFRTYTSVADNKIGQNYTATIRKLTISGDAGAGSVKLTWVDGGVTKSVLSASNGAYSLQVPYNWAGKITPSKVGVLAFVPAYRSYGGVTVNKTAQNYQANIRGSYNSMGALDGTVVESGENTGLGGNVNSTLNVFKVGDTATKAQSISMLAFDTTSLPDTAVILSVRLKLTLQSVAGVNPFNTHGTLSMDIKSPFFGATSGLAADDFNATSGRDAIGWISKTPVGAVYDGIFNATAFPYINKTGMTQLRLGFLVDDNNNSVADYLAFYSGDATNAAYKPVLLVTYYIP